MKLKPSERILDFNNAEDRKEAKRLVGHYVFYGTIYNSATIGFIAVELSEIKKDAFELFNGVKAVAIAEAIPVDEEKHWRKYLPKAEQAKPLNIGDTLTMKAGNSVKEEPRIYGPHNKNETVYGKYYEFYDAFDKKWKKGKLMEEQIYQLYSGQMPFQLFVNDDYLFNTGSIRDCEQPRQIRKVTLEEVRSALKITTSGYRIMIDRVEFDEDFLRHLFGEPVEVIE